MKNEINRQRKPLSNTKKHFCIFLALLMLFGAVIPVTTVPVSAAAGDSEPSRIEEVREALSAVSYIEYLKAKSGIYFDTYGKMPMGSGEIAIKPGDVLRAQTTAEGVQTSTQLGREALFLPDDGAVLFTFNVAKEGLYNLSFTYLQVVGKTSAIERMVKIDGKVPFKEARYITFTKTYAEDYLYPDADGTLKLAKDIANFDPDTMEPVFRRDIKDNEIRPTKSEAPEWRTVLAEDSWGFVEEPLLFYLTEGEHVLTLDAVREAVYISEIKFFVTPTVPTYEEYRAGFPDKKGTAEIELIQAEYPVATSEITIYPTNDRTSAITQPQDASRIRLNSIGGIKWQMVGQWIRYEFEVPAGGDGFYYIIPRFKQAVYSGVYSSRSVKLDGEVPFREADRLRFNFSDNWQTVPLNDGTILNPEAKKKNQQKQYFEFYLTEGKHTIEFEVVLGDMAELLGRVEESVMLLNDYYRKIRMITGATPDNFRDYGFMRQIPLVIEGMYDECIRLRGISAEFEAIIGAKGEHTVMLEKMALQLERMTQNTDRIAPAIGGSNTFKANIGNMATWLLERRNQPLEFDYIKIARIEDKFPKAEANFFEAAGFEFKSFIMSFFADYNSQGAMEELKDKSKVVEVWMGSTQPDMSGLALTGRDQAQILRQMVVDFTAEMNIQVNVKLVAQGSLLPSVLAGVGPDVAVSNWGGDAVNYAIRNAILPLNYDKDGNAVEYTKGDPGRGIKSFDEVKTYFNPAALVTVTLQNDRLEDKSKQQIFGVPETQTFPMMFYRKDIFVELDIDIPQTWQDLFDIVPALQKKNLEVGITPGIIPLYTFMFQQNIPLYKGDGIEINLNDNYALDSFKRMTDLYTIYKFPIEFDFANRFRSGEMPVSIQYYDEYNRLTVFAPEIRGLWEFVPLPGTIRKYDPVSDAGKSYETSPYNDKGEIEEGWIIDPSSPAGITTALMMRSAAEKKNTENSWAFMQWWVSAGTQGRFGSELVALMGAAAKYPTANLEALGNMPWPTADLNNLNKQFEYLKAVPEVPGGYIVQRYVDFVWRKAYNDGDSAIELMQDYNLEINKELSRKRQEFDMPIIKRDKQGRKIVEDDESLKSD